MSDLSTAPTVARPGGRRWRQFGLRSLLLIVTLVACGLGWLEWKRRHCRRSIEAVTGLTGVRFRAEPTMPHWLEELYGEGTFVCVRTVRFDRAFTDADMARLRDLPDLHSLDLEGTQITDDGLRQLPRFRELTHLELSNTRITEAGLAGVARQTSLRELYLDQTQVADLTPLACLDSLEALRLNWCPIGDSELRALAALPGLTSLELSFTEVTDDGLRHLAPLTNLAYLSLVGNRLTNASFSRLSGLKGIREINLGGMSNYMRDSTLFTWTALDKERAAYPQRQIFGNPAPDPPYEGLRTRCAAVRYGETAEFTIQGAEVLQVHEIANLSNLTQLDASRTYFDDQGMASLAGLESLERLNLAETWITDAGLVHLAGLDRLVELRLSDTRITDAGLVHLRRLVNLTTLDLSNTLVEGHGLQHLVGLTNLEALSLARKDGGRWPGRVRRLPGLEDDALHHLSGLTNLRLLSLSDDAGDGSRITDAGLAHLRELSGLQHLGIANSKCTEEGRTDLWRQLRFLYYPK